MRRPSATSHAIEPRDLAMFSWFWLCRLEWCRVGWNGSDCRPIAGWSNSIERPMNLANWTREEKYCTMHSWQKYQNIFLYLLMELFARSNRMSACKYAISSGSFSILLSRKSRIFKCGKLSQKSAGTTYNWTAANQISEEWWSEHVPLTTMALFAK